MLINFFSPTEVAPKNVITCTICVDLVKLADEAILSNSTIEQVRAWLSIVLLKLTLVGNLSILATNFILVVFFICDHSRCHGGLLGKKGPALGRLLSSETA